MNRLQDFRRFAEQCYGLPDGAMLTRGRPASIAHPRQIAMAAARELKPRPKLTDVRDAFNLRCHGTVMFACKKCARQPSWAEARDKLVRAWEWQIELPTEQPATASTG